MRARETESERCCNKVCAEGNAARLHSFLQIIYTAHGCLVRFFLIVYVCEISIKAINVLKEL